MPVFEPFAGIRYDCTAIGASLDAVTAPPYDVIDDHEREVLAARHHANAVQLILPHDGSSVDDRYVRAAAAFREWREQHLLLIDGAPRFYGYRMEFVDELGASRHTVGVIGALHLPSTAGEGDVLPHERTLPKAKSDRLDLLRATRANFDPIWGLSLAPGLTSLIDQQHELCSACDDDGVVHRLFAIDDPPAIEAIARAVASAPLVLADGHHRFETACNYRNERSADDAGAAAIMAFVVELADDELCIEAIHRLVILPAGLDARASLADAFTITPSTDDDHSALLLVDREGAWRLVPRPDVATAALRDEHDAVASTDAAIVEHLVVPRWREASWVYRHDAGEVAALVAAGTYDAGLLLRPATVAATRAAAMARVRMPQKTTFFYPKPRTGMVFRSLD